MPSPSDDQNWLPESQLLAICRLSRSTFQSWQRSGLSIARDSGAYDLTSVITLTVLVAIRDFLAPKDMVATWRHLVASGRAAEIVDAARHLRKGDRFDLIVEPESGALELAQSESELLNVVRYPAYPRPVVVVDAGSRMLTNVQAFSRKRNPTSPPTRKRPGRPRSADRAAHRAEGDS